MQIEDIHIKKLNLIQWISQLQNLSVKEKLSKIQEIESEIPKSQKDEVEKRFQELVKYPEKSIDIDNLVEEIRAEYEL